jgi:hypothetical protein
MFPPAIRGGVRERINNLPRVNRKVGGKGESLWGQTRRSLLAAVFRIEEKAAAL